MHDPRQHDPRQHDPRQHDPRQHDPRQHDPARHDLSREQVRGSRRGGGPGRGRGPRTNDTTPPPADGATSWFAGRLPDEWFTGPAQVSVDRDEIVVTGELSPPDTGDDDSPQAQQSAASGRIRRFREQTREERIAIAQEAEQRFGRNLAWGARVGDTREVFTSLSVPVMTRLHQDERLVLDTLVDSGVARSRSEALAWSVRLVGQNAGSWLDELREAMRAVEQVRAAGPTRS